MATRGEIYEKCGVVSLMTEDEANEELSEKDGVLLENILKKAFQSYLIIPDMMTKQNNLVVDDEVQAYAWTFFTRQGSVPWSFKHHSFCKSLFFPSSSPGKPYCYIQIFGKDKVKK